MQNGQEQGRDLGAATADTGAGSRASGNDGAPTTAASANRLAAIELPRGGGAIRGIDEKFAVNPATGTGTLTIPIAATHGRSGFGPQLSLTYDSGAGNGPFGVGWSLSLPAITRKTDKGLPRYRDGDETDTFLMPGTEDLVPVLDGAGARVSHPRTVHAVAYRVHLYRPRIEGLFARIERWTRTDNGVSHWRTITRDNVTSIFGFDEHSRVTSPDDPKRVFSYLICLRFDDKGNASCYDYLADDGVGVDRGTAHEANRTDAVRTTQRYAKQIRYGNVQPYFPDWSAAGADTPLPTDWRFHVVFDYGDHRAAGPAPTPDRAWPVRPDPFSSYRAGFEVRTYRRCRRVLLFHDFPGKPDVGAACLVRSTDFHYSDDSIPLDPRNPIYTFIDAVTQTGYGQTGAGPTQRSTPPVEFSYSQPEIHAEVLTLTDADSRANSPEGLDGSRFRFVDLDGEGLSGILTAEEGGWGYKRNLSPINLQTRPDGERVARARFGPLERVRSLPVPASLGTQQLLDLSGGGRLALVAFQGEMPGFFARTAHDDWEPLRTFPSLPRLDWTEPNLKFVDLTGDGRADLLVTEEDVYSFYPSLGEAGFDTVERVQTPWDEEHGPRVVFADGTQTVSLADMSGDGLSDLVRVRNGEICYWPNLGYGRFGAKVTMDRAPRLADEERFDPRRVRLADIDGSGTTDLLYLGDQGVQVAFNRCGNSWGEPHLLSVFPDAATAGAIQVIDLLGNGTACLVWSSPLPGETYAPLRYVDLMGSRKPHLLVGTRNNLGAETRLAYAPSTRFYLDDRQAGRPWLTRLPFPVHVVERVEIYDWIGRSRFVTLYAYHHGYFDGEEREFRGFGMVEQWDTERHRDDTLFPDVEPANERADSFVPPMHTRTWFHTGGFVEAGEASRQFATEYWVEPALRADTPAARAEREALLLPDTVLEPGLTADEMREACRALKGSILRSEVFADDGTPRAEHPYIVTEQNYTVTRVQPFGPNRHAVFLTHAREARSYHYERQPSDPRVAHDMTLAVDEFANVLRSVSIGYGRRPGFPEPEPSLSGAFRTMLAHDQARLHVRATVNGYTNPVNRPTDAAAIDVYRAPLPCETTTAELRGVTPATRVFGFAEMDGHVVSLWTGAQDVPHEEVSALDIDGTGISATPGRRVVERSLTLYRRDDMTGLSAVGVVEGHALPGESYRLALTPGLVTRVFGSRVTDPMLMEGGHVRLPGQSDWWIPSGRLFYSPGDGDLPPAELVEARLHFYQPRRTVDPFGAVSRVTCDDDDLLPVASTDALGNVTATDNDYRSMQPRRVTDPNGNSNEVVFDCLGQVVGTAVHGKAGEGDSLLGFEAELSDAAIQATRDTPLLAPATLLGNATTRIVYDRFAYFRTRNLPAPDAPMVYTLTRETHVPDLGAGEPRFQHAFAYSDGFGRMAQHKVQAERGPVPEVGDDVSPRWVGSGWTIYNNKGKPVRRYEPYFTATHRFEFNRQAGVSSVIFYDPTERVVAAVHPDNRFEKTVFDAWRKESWDANDTVLIGDPRTDTDIGGFFLRLFGAGPGAYTSWYDRRIGGTLGSTPEERSANQDAAQKASAHAGTPTVVHVDSLGRARLSVADNGVDAGVPRRFATRTALDTQGRHLAVIDPLGRRAQEQCVREPFGGGFRYVAGYDLAGRSLYRNHMDSGEQHTLSDVAGNPVRTWNTRGFVFRLRYDALRRITHRFVGRPGSGEMLIERSIYGERHPDPSRNLKGRLFRQYDGAGVASHERHDFKGNLAQSVRHFARHVPGGAFPPDYRQAPDWSAIAAITELPALDIAALDAATAPLLVEADRFMASTRFDALNRATQLVLPHRAIAPANRPSIVQPVYNEANLLERIDVWSRQVTAPAALLAPATADLRAVSAIGYNARRQRLQLALGNDAVTSYRYDPETFRLVGLTTSRLHADADARTVQDLAYSYDPVGNITRVRDTADIQNVVYFRNQRVEPSADYTYDALYRLIHAAGREHLGQSGGVLLPAQQPADDDAARVLFAARGDGDAMGIYAEHYEYDGVGNIIAMVHQVASGGWTRRCSYLEPSRISPAEMGNRLSASSLPGDNVLGPYSAAYSYDERGNTVTMPHLPTVTWDEEDRLLATSRQVVLAGTPETTFYSYDGGGQRLRKLTDWQASQGATPTRKSERLYLGALEIYREYAPDGTTLTKERETLHILDNAQRVAILEIRTAGSDPAPERLVRYQHTNHLGSAVLELDDAADVISYEEFFPYGGTAYLAVRGSTETPKRYRYTGKERDEESGLYYHGARYYAPWLGRWTAVDPIGLADGVNGYQYVSGNPIVLRDAQGTDGDTFSVDRNNRTYQSSGDQATTDVGKVAKELWKPAKDSPELKAAQKLFLDPALSKLTSSLEADWKKDKVPMIIGGVLVLVPTAVAIGMLTVDDQKLDVPIAGEVHTRSIGFGLLSLGLEQGSKALFDDKAKIDISYERKDGKERFGYQQTQPFLSEKLKLTFDSRFGTEYSKIGLGLEYTLRSDTKWSLSGAQETDAGKPKLSGKLGVEFPIAGAPFKLGATGTYAATPDPGKPAFSATSEALYQPKIGGYRFQFGAQGFINATPSKDGPFLSKPELDIVPRLPLPIYTPEGSGVFFTLTIPNK